MTSFPSLLQLSDTLDLSSLVVAQGKHLSLLLSSGSLRGGGRSTTLVVLCDVRERKELSMQSKFWLRKAIRLCGSSSPLFVLVSTTGSVCCYQGYVDCVCLFPSPITDHVGKSTGSLALGARSNIDNKCKLNDWNQLFRIKGNTQCTKTKKCPQLFKGWTAISNG